ncbi:hypothetical protein ONZ45_g16571 [Pleurotus djamor]|nr:hypothetical protein ONZ45_g16571 [Pleurotus djamor]
MNKQTLLFASLKDLSTPHFLSTLISDAAASTLDRLLIVLVLPPQAQDTSHTKQWNAVQRILTFVYVQATKVAQDADRVLMSIDVVLKATDRELADVDVTNMEAVYLVQGDPPFDHEASRRRSTVPPAETSSYPSLYHVVALGGTFDHLHAGHKILLSMGAWITEKKMIVGVTDDALLKSKANKHLLEPLSTRIARVQEFLALFKPELTYDVVPIEDVYGPTGWDPNVQALVVSKETLGGAASIAKHRAERGFPALETFVIDVISPSDSNLDHEDIEMLKQTKMSSTFIREWIAKQQNNEGHHT